MNLLFRLKLIGPIETDLDVEPQTKRISRHGAANYVGQLVLIGLCKMC